MTTFGSRLSTCYRVLQKERLLTYGVDSPGQSRGISPLQGGGQNNRRGHSLCCRNKKKQRRGIADWLFQGGGQNNTRGHSLCLYNRVETKKKDGAAVIVCSLLLLLLLLLLSSSRYMHTSLMGVVLTSPYIPT